MANTVIGTLPAGARPGTTQYFTLDPVSDTSVASRTSISPAGAITIINPTPTPVLAFGSVHFRAEN